MAERRYRVVIADDADDLRFAYRLILERHASFMVVGEAGTGREAVDVAAALQPDLLLLDVSMPDMDGMEALPFVREAAPGARVVVLSGFNASRLGGMALERGASRYLEKGITPEEMVRQLLDVLGDGAPEAPARIATLAGAAVNPATEDVLGAMAHEIRNPLTVIQGLTATLVRHLDEMPLDEAVDLAARTYRQARFLDGIVRTMLMLPALESGDALLDPTRYPAASLLRDLATELEHVAPNHTVAVELPDDLPEVIVDRERFQQVLVNVVANAAKFSPPATAIRITAARSGREILVSVADEGPGVEPELREKVFEKFVQARPTGAGMGIGLYVARALMGAMGGHIWIADTDTGTTVCCTLPVAGARPAAESA